MKGLAIDVVQAIIIMVFVLLLVTFLFSGVWKDVITAFGKDPADPESIVIDNSNAAITIYCTPQNPYNYYEISLDRLKANFREPVDMLAILFFKGMAKLPESGVITKNIIESGNIPRLEYRISSAQDPSGSEILSLNFFSYNERCMNLGRGTTTIDDFISKCAGNYIGATRIAGTSGTCIMYRCNTDSYTVITKTGMETRAFDPSISFCCAYNANARGNYRSIGVCPRGDTCNPDTGCSTRPPNPVPCSLRYNPPGTIIGCADRYGEHTNFCFGCRYICRYRCSSDICECEYPNTCSSGLTCINGACIVPQGPVIGPQCVYPYYLCNGQYISRIGDASYDLRWRDCGVGRCCVFNNYKSYSCCPSNLQCNSAYGCIDPNNPPRLCDYSQTCSGGNVVTCKGTNPRPDTNNPNVWIAECGYNPYVRPECNC